MATLDALKQQRALMAAHLAWLDAEIAAQSKELAKGEAPVPAAEPATAPAEPAPQAKATLAQTKTAEPGPATVDPVTHQFIEQYQNQATQSPQDARKGCLRLFGFALGLLVCTVLAIYFIGYF